MADTIKTAYTPDGFIVRFIYSYREEAYRYNNDGTVSHCADHKGPWTIVHDWFEVPDLVRRLFGKSRLTRVTDEDARLMARFATA